MLNVDRIKSAAPILKGLYELKTGRVQLVA